MTKKTDIVKAAIRSGDLKKALKIAKDFRINVTAEQREKMSRAYECMVHPEFYKQIGTNVIESIEIGTQTLTLLYGK